MTFFDAKPGNTVVVTKIEGAFEVDVDWDGGELTTATVTYGRSNLRIHSLAGSERRVIIQIR